MLRRHLNSENRQLTLWQELSEGTATVVGFATLCRVAMMLVTRFILTPNFALWVTAVCWQSLAVAQTSSPPTEPGIDRSEPIVLRDLTLVRNDPVASFDEQGVMLDSQKRIGWSKILQAKVDDQRQPEFDRYLREVGLPLFRLESRLEKRDWAGIGEVAEPMYDSLCSGSLVANEELKFLVCRATMESRCYRSQPMEAIEPFLRAAAHQTRLDQDAKTALNPWLLPANDVAQMVSERLLPIWFDGAKAAQVYARLDKAIENGQVPRTSGALVYLASLAVAAENYGLADQLIAEIRKTSSGQDRIADWASVVEANRRLSSGETGQGRQILSRLIGQLDGAKSQSAARAIALYLAGAYPDQDTFETQMLNLLRVPAIYGERYSNLSAAALYKAFTISREKSDPKQARILVNELLRRYPNTYHGRLAAIEK